MSPRAAWRLQDLGFERVYDYVPGKADWFASGLPREGNLASIPTVGDVARPEVPTCSSKEKASNARERTREAGWDTCVVVNEERVVFGLVRIKEELESDPAATVEEVMVAGPTTYRPNVPVGKAVERMRKRGVPAVLVTTSDGRLIGQLYREDAERQTENLRTSENSASTHFVNKGKKRRKGQRQLLGCSEEAPPAPLSREKDDVDDEAPSQG